MNMLPHQPPGSLVRSSVAPHSAQAHVSMRPPKRPNSPSIGREDALRRARSPHVGHGSPGALAGFSSAASSAAIRASIASTRPGSARIVFHPGT